MRTKCIEPSNSPYASPLVPVRKKNGSIRVCIDYRALNKDTVADRYPIPRNDELIDAIGRQKGNIFSSLDLMKGYHQVRMVEDSKLKTAFTCHMGLFQYRRMPFGLTNTPATFQRLMNKLFQGSDWDFVFIYLDYILIVSTSVEEHITHLKRVLQRLDEVGLRLKPSKCHFAKRQIDYLGYTLSPDGVRPNSKKVEAVQNFPQPRCSKLVKQFLGLVNFYRRHIPNLAAISRPLTSLTRKDKVTEGFITFDWSTDCEESFCKLKELLTTAPVLHHPDLSKEFYLWTDGSELGLGAVLEQQGEDGHRHPIAFASCQTNEAERKYAPTEMEVAALVFAVEHFEVYLLGNKTVVYTDHQALVSAFLSHMKSQTKGLLARWYLRFLPNIQLEYKPGHANAAADALSHSPMPAGQVLHVANDHSLLAVVQQEQQKDPELSQLIMYLRDKTLPTDTAVARQVVL